MNITILDVHNEQDCQKVARLDKFWVLSNRNSAMFVDVLAEVTESSCIPLLMMLEWRDVVVS